MGPFYLPTFSTKINHSRRINNSVTLILFVFAGWLEQLMWTQEKFSLRCREMFFCDRGGSWITTMVFSQMECWPLVQSRQKKQTKKQTNRVGGHTARINSLVPNRYNRNIGCHNDTGFEHCWTSFCRISESSTIDLLVWFFALQPILHSVKIHINQLKR